MASAKLAGLGPVLPAERIQALDVLRGWALFGVLWSNLNEHYGTTNPVTALDRGLEWTQYRLVSGRFYTLLAIMFGVGFGIQLARAQARGNAGIGFHYRRAGALLAIGVGHGLLIWHGDILVWYALAALMLGVFRDLRPTQLLIAAAIVALVIPEIPPRLAFATGLPFRIPSESGATGDWILGHGTWTQVAAVRAHRFVANLSGIFLGIFWDVVMKFLVGLWAVRSGYLRRLIEESGTAWRLLGWCAVAYAVGEAWYRVIPGLWPPCGPWTAIDWCFWKPRRMGLHLLDWRGEAQSLAYAATWILVARTARGARIAHPLAAVGRMGLTTYLTQSIACTLLFFGFGLGLYGRVGFTGMLGVTVLLYAAQMAFSMVWLARYPFGPAEWMWRKMTYGRGAQMGSSGAI